MIAVILRRLVWLVPNLVVLTFVLFGVMTRWLGSPSAMMLGTDASPQAIAQLNTQFGFNQPIPIQYAHWVGRALAGNLGRSYATQQSVASMVLSALPVTLELSLWAVLLAFLLSVFLNTVVHARRAIGGLMIGASIFGVTIPNFMLGALLIFLFSARLHWLPTTGWVPWSQGAGQHLLHLVMPVVTLSAFYFGSFSMIYRAEYNAIRRQLFVRVALAKGLSETRVSFRHIMPNSVVPVVTSLGISLGRLIGGAVVTETVFSIPGIGRLFVSAIGSYDYPVILAVGMIVIAGVMLMNLATDIALAALNPQVRL